MLEEHHHASEELKSCFKYKTPPVPLRDIHEYMAVIFIVQMRNLMYRKVKQLAQNCKKKRYEEQRTWSH